MDERFPDVPGAGTSQPQQTEPEISKDINDRLGGYQASPVSVEGVQGQQGFTEKRTDYAVSGADESRSYSTGASDVGGSDVGTGYSGGQEQSFSNKASDYASRGREQARHYGDIARKRLMKTADQRKQYFASELENFAGTLDVFGRTLADRGHDSRQQWIQKGSGMLRRFSRELRQNSAEDLYQRAEEQVRNRPGAFIAGCLVAGFLGARLLRG